MLPKRVFVTLRILFLCTGVFDFAASEVYRLPKTVKPIRYTLTIEPNLEPDLSPAPYNGSVIIELKVLENTRNVTLHKRKLKIDEDSIEVVDADGGKVKVFGIFEDVDNEIYTIRLERDLLKDSNYTITIGKFTNNLGHRNVGFYLAKYYDKNKTQRRLAVTDFEPTDARMAFPCFDEPGIKAKFVINLIRKKEHNSVSNQELDSTLDLGNGKFQDTFKETPEMSAYLVAFVISDYKHTETLERHRIFGRSDDVDDGGFKYALQMGVEILKALEDYTGIKYPMNKMDQFAVPDLYFEDDAMENWGLVIYGESHLLCTNSSSANDLKRCTVYIAHEFAHQWFGNLVTPAWWNYTWLSESVAAYFQYYIGSVVQPTWRLMDLFVIENVQYGLESEVSTVSTSLNYDLRESGDFPPLNILYAKGSSIVRMTQHFLTEELFKSGIQMYLQDRKYSTAEPSDLYRAFQKAVDDAHAHHLLGDISIADIMLTWDTNDEFPVVTVTRDYSTGYILLKQETFDNRVPNAERYWIIPVNYIFQSNDPNGFSNTTADFWLTRKNMTLSEKFPTDGWLIINKQQTGYYRVNYDKENWERIIAFMNTESFKSIHVLNRAQLIDDAFNLAKLKYIPYDIPLRLCDYLVQEKDYIPFAAFYNGMRQLRIFFRIDRMTNNYFGNYTLKNTLAPVTDEYEIFQLYMKTTLSGIADYLGLEDKPDDTLLDKLNRAELTHWLCRFDHPKCLKYASEKVKEFEKNKEAYVSPEVEENVLCKGLKNATETEFDSIYTVYSKSKDIYQQRRLRKALYCSKFGYEKYGPNI